MESVVLHPEGVRAYVERGKTALYAKIRKPSIIVVVGVAHIITITKSQNPIEEWRKERKT